MKIGAILDSFRQPIRDAIKSAAALGVSGVQFYTVKGELAPENITDSGVADLKHALAASGLSISALCGDLGGFGFEISKDNGWKVEKSKRILDLALKLGATVVTTHIGVVPDDQTSATWKTMADACNELASYGDKIGATFAVETGPESPELLKRFLDGLSARGVRVNYDPANLAMVTASDPVAGVAVLKDYIVHTHAKDGVNYKPCDRARVYHGFASGNPEKIDYASLFNETPLGEGDVQWPDYIAALRASGYDGFLTIEREVGDDPARDIGKAVRFLTPLLNR
jgi:sugar phosphate isomerase/epimerase